MVAGQAAQEQGAPTAQLAAQGQDKVAAAQTAQEQGALAAHLAAQGQDRVAAAQTAWEWEGDERGGSGPGTGRDERGGSGPGTGRDDRGGNGPGTGRDDRGGSGPGTGGAGRETSGPATWRAAHAGRAANQVTKNPMVTPEILCGDGRNFQKDNHHRKLHRSGLYGEWPDESLSSAVKDT